MKKFLAIIMALTLVTVMGVNFVAFADEPEVTSNEEIVISEDEAAPVESAPSLQSVKPTLVYDFTGEETIAVSQFFTGNDEDLQYLYAQAAASGLEATIEDKDGVKTMSMAANQVTKDDLNYSGIDYVVDKGLFSTKTTYLYLIGTLSQTGLEDGEVYATVRFLTNGFVSYTNADRVRGGIEKVLYAGESGTIVAVTTSYNWLAIVLIVLIILAIAAIVALVIISRAKKKAAGIEADEDELYEEPFIVIEDDVEEITEEVIEEKPEETKEEKKEE